MDRGLTYDLNKDLSHFSALQNHLLNSVWSHNIRRIHYPALTNSKVFDQPDYGVHAIPISTPLPYRPHPLL